ncbi:MAG: serpin family protein [Myxococcaceae bacterium]
MNFKRLFGALVVSSSILFSCTNGPAPAPTTEAKSNLARITTAAPQADLDATVAGLNDFTLSLNKRITVANQNFISAPSSVTCALGMASAGAASTTLDAFRSTLRVAIPQNDFHHAMNTIDRELTSRGQGAQGTNGRPFKLSIVNQSFVQQGMHLESSYLDLLALQYGAGVRLVDFQTQPEPARVAINDFVSQNTAGLIPELLAQGTIDPSTRVVLTNAVYFNASWASPFEKNQTAPAPFTLGSGATVNVDTLRDSAHPANGANVNGVEVVELPYQKNEVSMVILMPPAGQLASFEQGLDRAQLDSLIAATRPEELDFTMPKFSIDTESPLVGPLTAEGLGVAFGSDADFSAMTGDRSLQITNVIHHAVIKVTEEGTEAAGATAIIIGVTSIPLTRTVHVDRPFVFLIRDRATNTILFMGHVVDPR